jgi:hypothetical protein
MRLAAVAAPSVAGAAVLLLALGACSSAGTQWYSAGAAQHSPATAQHSSAAAERSADVAPGTPGTPGTPGAVASPTAGWTVIEPSASVAPAAAQAASDLTAYPSASAYSQSSTEGEYSIAGVGVSGSGEYVDAYSVSYVCGAGIADDCDRFVGTPEYRIPLTSGVRFTLLGADTQPNLPVDFATFRQYAAGTDGKYDGSYDLFVFAFTGNHQATSLTAVYTP